ncbi:hypothetical protein GG344DRAFT_75247 [Lentinula edodes]|nr:hypothetical protein GG344DRAFT_75247 [Lentinula edodes]
MNDRLFSATTLQTNSSNKRPDSLQKSQKRSIATHVRPAASMEAFNSVQPSTDFIAIDMKPSYSSSGSPYSSGSRSMHETSRPYPYFPPRRPIQRSLFADKQNPHTPPESMLFGPLLPQFSPNANFHEGTNHTYLPRTNPHHSAKLSPTARATQPQPGNLLSSKARLSQVQPRPQPLPSPLKSFFDFTVQNLYSGLTHLQSAWNTALYKERKDKELMRMHFLKMQRERDIALERARDFELKYASASYSVVEAGKTEKRPREDDAEGDYNEYSGNIQLPTPPASGTFPSSNTVNRHLLNVSPVETDDWCSLVYPNESSVSPSPPPPPISGRQMFFPTDIHLTSSSPDPPSKPLESSFKTPVSNLALPSHSSRPSRPSSPTGSDQGSVCSSSSSKRRRLSTDSLSSHSSCVTAFETLQDDSLFEGRAPSRSSRDPSNIDMTRRLSNETNSDDSEGECDMDISEDDSNSEMDFARESPTPGLGLVGKKLLFNEETVEEVRVPSESLVQGDRTAASFTAVQQKAITSSFKLDIPRLNLQDLNRMYFNYDGIIYCRACWCAVLLVTLDLSSVLSEFYSSRKPHTRWRCSSPLPLMYARQVDLDVLMNHCTSQHPVAYSDVAGLSLDQVFRLQKLLKANVPSNETSTI